MKFRLQDLNPGAWFNFDVDDPETGRIRLRVLNAQKLTEIRDTTMTNKVEYHADNRFEYQEIDNAARDRIIWDYCIIEWEGLVDDDDVPIECTTDNKIKLMNGHIGFSTFIEACLEKLNKENEKFREFSEKN